jgi:tetratricopeptide (TPR) repeat protein
LRQAIKRDPRHRAAHVELAQVLLAAGQPKDSLAVVDRAMPQLRSGETAPLRMARCDALLALGQPERALAECQRSCQENPHEIEWLLKRSQLDAQLGLHAQRVAELAAARREQPAGLLQIEWVEALLDAGRAADSLPTIKAELADSRLQSSWLIRRARARLLLGSPREAAADLHAAIAEINERIHPERPDLTLLADRGLAYALLDDRDTAERDLQFAKTRRADPWMLWRLERALAQKEVAK